MKAGFLDNGTLEKAWWGWIGCHRSLYPLEENDFRLTTQRASLRIARVANVAAHSKYSLSIKILGSLILKGVSQSKRPRVGCGRMFQ